VRAVLEGVAFNLRACVEAFKAEGTSINTVSVVGGGAASDLWLQIFADVLGVPVSRRSTISDANSLGCAITTLVGVGAVDGFEMARTQSSRQATFLPGMWSDNYALAAGALRECVFRPHRLVRQDGSFSAAGRSSARRAAAGRV